MRCRLKQYFCRFRQYLLLVAPVVLVLTCIPATAQRFNCSSNGQYQECEIPGHGNPHDLRIVRQYSQQPCVEGRTWGRHGNRVWVDQGCRADFELGREEGGDRDHDRDHQGGPGWDRQPAYYSGSFSDGHSNCSSGQGSGAVYCQSGGAFRYANPLRVNNLCVENRTWGVSQYGLWVADGCAGEWEIKREGGPQADYQSGPDNDRDDHHHDYDRDHRGGAGWDRPPAYYSGKFSDGHSRCSSGQGSGPVYCQSGGAFRYANPLRVNNSCVQNRTWGVTQYGLWVANGCEGEWEIKR
jgi:Protein of unknown function (DUF3011)